MRTRFITPFYLEEIAFSNQGANDHNMLTGFDLVKQAHKLEAQ